MPYLRSLSAVALAALMIQAAPLTSSASPVTIADDGKRKINLAGRQRMLSQRMAKAVCFASIGVMVDDHLAMGAEAHALFDRTLVGLRDGDVEQGMNPERSPAVLEELAAVETLWQEYGVAVDAALDGADAASNALEAVARLNGPTLTQMNVAVGAFERQYGATEDIHPALALAINVSGRQRMLSQKASKEFCLILAGVDADANRAALGETVALFDRSLTALTDGDDAMGLPEAPTDQIYDQLVLVSGIWQPLKQILGAVAAGADPSDADIQRVATENNTLLVEMNRAVWMYDGI